MPLAHSREHLQVEHVGIRALRVWVRVRVRVGVRVRVRVRLPEGPGAQASILVSQTAAATMICKPCRYGALRCPPGGPQWSHRMVLQLSLGRLTPGKGLCSIIPSAGTLVSMRSHNWTL